MIKPQSKMEMSDWLSLKIDYHELNVQKVVGEVCHNNVLQSLGKPPRKFNPPTKPKIECKEFWQIELYNLSFDDWNAEIYTNIYNKYINMQIQATNDELNYLMFSEKENDSFKLLCILERDSAIQKELQKISDLVAGYVSDYILKFVVDKEKFVNQCKGLVTVYLFQTPYILCDTKEKRDIYYSVMCMWNPNWFVLEFCKQLNQVFEAL